MKESQLRDLVVENLHILNPNFKYLKKEAYLPSDVGTRSFIDILALNENGKYIVIEIKKSDVSARQAIHELFKYLEALKENLALRSDEVELIVASTEWDELLVPFSSFISNVDIKSTGFQLFVNDKQISAKEIDASHTNEDRIFSSVQMARYYSSDEYDKGIQAHKSFFRNRGLENFVLIVLKAPENYKALVIESLKKNGIDKMFDLEKAVPNFNYMIYSANQLVSVEKYLQICDSLYQDSEINEDIQEIVANDEASDYDKMEQLNNILLEQEPFPDADSTEIGTPAKYVRFREEEGWELIGIQKFGALSENVYLTDDLIEQEIKASGTTGERYISEIDVNNSANISRVKREIKNCLSDNIVWRNHILEVIDSLITEKKKVKKVRCSIYNPMNIIYSIHLICSRPDGILFIPSYQIEVTMEEEKRMYMGFIDGVFENVTMTEILDKFYNSNEFEFMLPLTWGGYNKNNLEVSEFIGINYKTMLVVLKGENKTFFNYKNYRFIESDFFDPISNFLQKLSEENSLVGDILRFFDDSNLENNWDSM